MKLIIDIPEDVYKRTVFYREFKDLNDCVTTIKALENGTPLDDVKAKVQDLYVGYRHGYEIKADVLQILDNIGKEERR